MLTKFAEFRDYEKKYVLSLLEEVKENFGFRREFLKEELSKIDEEFAAKTRLERDKKARSTKELDKFLEYIKPAKNDSLVSKLYKKIADSVFEVELEREYILDTNEQVRTFRKKELRPLLESSISIHTEIELTEILVSSIDDFSDKIMTSQVIESETEVESLTDEKSLRDRLEFLYQQKKLKTDKFTRQFINYIKFNNANVDDIDVDELDSPYAKRALEQIKKINEEIAEIEAKLALLV